MALRSFVEYGISDELGTIDINNRSCGGNVGDGDYALGILRNRRFASILYCGRKIASWRYCDRLGSWFDEANSSSQLASDIQRARPDAVIHLAAS